MFQVDQSNLISLYSHLQEKQWRTLPVLQHLRSLVDGIVPVRKSKSLCPVCKDTLKLNIPHSHPMQVKFSKFHIGQPSSESAPSSNTAARERQVTIIGASCVAVGCVDMKPSQTGLQQSRTYSQSTKPRVKIQWKA